MCPVDDHIVMGEEFAYATDSLYTITADNCAHKCHKTKLCQGSVTVSTLTHREVDTPGADVHVLLLKVL